MFLYWGVNRIMGHFLIVTNIKILFIDAHLKFAPWAESNGEQYQEWYKDMPGYRNGENIYQAP